MILQILTISCILTSLTAAYKHCFPGKIRQVSQKSLTPTSRCQPCCAASSTTWVCHPLLNWPAQRDPTSVGITWNDSTLSFECEIYASHPAISRELVNFCGLQILTKKKEKKVQNVIMQETYKIENKFPFQPKKLNWE